MKSILEEMQEYNDKELRLLGFGILADLEQNTSLFHVYPNIKKIAIELTNEFFPFPKDAEAFQLSPQQMYFRARMIEKLQEVVKKNV